MSDGKFEKAITYFKSALDAEPKAEQFWLSLLDALFKCNKLDEAKQILNLSKARTSITRHSVYSKRNCAKYKVHP